MVATWQISTLFLHLRFLLVHHGRHAGVEPHIHALRFRQVDPFIGQIEFQPRRPCEKQDWDQAAAGNAALACSTIAWNAAGSWMARSDSTLRSTNSPAFARPSINRL